MSIWDDIITDRDRLVYEKSGHGKTMEPGKKPAVLVIDVTTAFIGDKPEPILKSIERFPNSCGEEGWNAVTKIKDLINTARRKKIPVIYSTGAKSDEFTYKGEVQKHTKDSRALMRATKSNSPQQIPAMIAPQPGDIVIRKFKPSVFYGTPLTSYLIHMGIDTLLVTGCTTSGCVRASVIDAYSRNFHVLVVEDGTFDRGQTSHKVNLFDMNQKYANVVSLSDAKNYIASL